jgi:hypothetical protein
MRLGRAVQRKGLGSALASAMKRSMAISSSATDRNTRGGSWGQSASSNRGMNASALRCALLISRPTTVSNAAAQRSLRRPRRVSPGRHRAESQDDGAPSTRPANRSVMRVDCISGMAIRTRCSRPCRDARPAAVENVPHSQRFAAGHFSTASTQGGHGAAIRQ